MLGRSLPFCSLYFRRRLRYNKNSLTTGVHNHEP